MSLKLCANMYNPSRGGVRGGADQFTWESVKSDKHRENYLGHSLKAPVGRWQKGKDLSWYSKERKDDTEEQFKLKKSELLAIKRAEEEAMLTALGHNVVRKEVQPLSKEEIKDALKRNIGERDEQNIERIDGLGAGRRALLGGTSTKLSNEGVLFETTRKRMLSEEKQNVDSQFLKRSKNKKKSKKHKHKKSKFRDDVNSDDSGRTKHCKKHEKSLKKKKKCKYYSSSSDSDSDFQNCSKNRK